LRLLGRRDEAERMLDHLLATAGEFGPALAAKGQLQLEAGKATEAIASFQTAIAKRSGSDHAFAKSGLAKALAQVGRLAEAEGVLDELVQLAPDSAEDWASLAVVRYQRGAAEAALEAVNRAIALEGSAQTHYQRVAILLQLGREKEAIADLRFVIGAGVEGSHAVRLSRLLLGRALCAAERFEEAASQLRLFLADPNDCDTDEQIQTAVVGIGLCLARLGHAIEGRYWMQHMNSLKVDARLQEDVEAIKRMLDELPK
jgi:hypothetical protein